MEDYTVLDIETTGLSKHHHKITEIAALRFVDGRAVSEFQTLVNPGVRIPSFITRLTGITDEMVRDADPINLVMPKFLSFLEDSVIVAHNATFDHGFLSHNALNYLNHSMKNSRLCTKKLANRLVPDLPNKKLSSLCQYFNVVNEQAHRAMADVKATAKVFDHFLEMLARKNIRGKEAVMNFERSPVSRVRQVF